MDTLGSRVKKLRQGLGLSQLELAKLTTTTQATLSRLESDKMSQLKSKNLKSLASALRVSLDFLVGEAESQEAEDVIVRDGDARELISAYSMMDAVDRKQLRNFAEFLLKGQRGT